MSEISYPLSGRTRTKGFRYYLRVLRVVGVIEFKAKYAGAALGYVWSMVKPLAYLDKIVKAHQGISGRVNDHLAPSFPELGDRFEVRAKGL